MVHWYGPHVCMYVRCGACGLSHGVVLPYSPELVLALSECGLELDVDMVGKGMKVVGCVDCVSYRPTRPDTPNGGKS